VVKFSFNWSCCSNVQTSPIYEDDEKQHPEVNGIDINTVGLSVHQLSTNFADSEVNHSLTQLEIDNKKFWDLLLLHLPKLIGFWTTFCNLWCYLATFCQWTVFLINVTFLFNHDLLCLGFYYHLCKYWLSILCCLPVASICSHHHLYGLFTLTLFIPIVYTLTVTRIDSLHELSISQ